MNLLTWQECKEDEVIVPADAAQRHIGHNAIALAPIGSLYLVCSSSTSTVRYTVRTLGAPRSSRDGSQKSKMGLSSFAIQNTQIAFIQKSAYGTHWLLSILIRS